MIHSNTILYWKTMEIIKYLISWLIWAMIAFLVLNTIQSSDKDTAMSCMNKDLETAIIETHDYIMSATCKNN